MNQALRHARNAAGLSFAAVANAGLIDRGTLCKVEQGKRTPTENVIRAYEKALGMHRREIFTLAAAALGVALTADDRETIGDLYASIASGDDTPLATVQTTHAVDHSIQALAIREKRTVNRLRAWLHDGGTAELRVNAAGILAKTRKIDLADEVALALARDTDARGLYLAAVRRRVGDDPADLAAELRNDRDSGARWCAAWLLAGSGQTPALAQAMRTEPSRETLRVMALAATGALHDDVQD
ncbi:helix-turn-helix transcriptional regulator [Glycomyces sp. NPDC046736]|uniref:helix-turn-helix domain-containing protein n=1 Tax=Glycomyces sp. NPDC046736 TaxID=3155615 RepID=UPI00340A7ECE